MQRKQKLTLILVAACVLVAVLAVAWCVWHSASGKGMQEINIRKYITAEKNGDGSFSLGIDYDELLTDNHLPNPNTNDKVNADDYPDVKAIYTLGVIVEPEGEDYRITISSTDANISSTLKKYNIKLMNTESWVWTKSEIMAVYKTSQEYPRKLSAKSYVKVDYSNGNYMVSWNKEALLADTGWQLSSDQAELNADEGYLAVQSLGFMTTSQDNGGYLITTTSTMTDVVDKLYANGIEITDTSFSLSSDEIVSLFNAQGGVIPTDTPTPTATPTPSPTPTATPYVEPTATPVYTAEPVITPTIDPNATPSPTPTPTPTPSPTPSPTPTPAINTDTSNCLTTLYGYDQYGLRVAIKAAKESYYGSAFKSSEVIANYFIVRSDDSQQYANCFRLVYKITTTDGTKYMAADVYNIHASDSISKSNVVLKEYQSKAAANTTGDFSSNHNTVYTLDGGNMVYSKDSGKSWYDDEGLVFAKSLTEKVTTADIWNLPQSSDYNLLKILGFARNEIFARCGHKYDTDGNYYKHFSKYSWYKPTGSITVDEVKAKYPTGAVNILFIKGIETLIREG